MVKGRDVMSALGGALRLAALAVGLGAPLGALATPEECPEPVGVEALTARMDTAEAAFSGLDLDTFTEELDVAAIELGCLQGTLSTPQVARYHRLQGLRQFVARNEDRAVQAFAAGRNSLPDFELSPALVPEGHVIRDLYERMPLANGSTRTVGEPRRGTLLFDGIESTERPTAWPTLVQLLDRDGETEATVYAYPGDALPGYAAKPLAAPPVAALPFLRTKRQLYMAGGGLLLGAAAGVTYGLAAVSAETFEQDHPEWDNDRLVAHRKKTNMLVGLSIGLGAGAVGLTTTAVVGGPQ